VTIQIQAIEQYSDVVLFIMLYKVVLTLMSVDETLVCDHSNESYWAVLRCGSVYYAVQGGSNFNVCGWNPSVWPFKRKLLSSTWYSTVYYSALSGSNFRWGSVKPLQSVTLNTELSFKSVDESLVCDYSNESYWAVLSCGTVYHAVQGSSNF